MRTHVDDSYGDIVYCDECHKLEDDAHGFIESELPDLCDECFEQSGEYLDFIVEELGIADGAEVQIMLVELSTQNKTIVNVTWDNGGWRQEADIDVDDFVSKIYKAQKEQSDE